MRKVFISSILGLVASSVLGFAAMAAPEICKDCSSETGLSIREQIKAERARAVDRISKESTDRPWDSKDGKDFGRPRQPNMESRRSPETVVK